MSAVATPNFQILAPLQKRERPVPRKAPSRDRIENPEAEFDSCHWPIHRDEYMVKIYESNQCSMSDTAKALGTTQGTLRDRLNRNPELRKRFEEIEDARIDKAERKLDDKINDGDFRAIKFFLETKGRRRGYGKQVEITGGTTNKTLNINVDMTLEEAYRAYQDTLYESPEAAIEDL